jgi:hypothetical protein
MKRTIARVAFSVALMSSTAMAEERATDAASAVVRRPIGAVAGAVNRIYGRAVDFAHSWGLNQSSTPRQPRSVARREQRVPIGESQPGSTPPAPPEHAAPQAAAPAPPSATTTASTAPPVQPLE